MKTYYYTIGKEPFDKWAEEHADCENLFFEGTIFNDIEGLEISKYDAVLCNMPYLRVVDVNKLHIEGNFGEEGELVSYDHVYISNPIWFDYGFSLGILGRMVLNKDYSGIYFFNAEEVSSCDGKTLVWVKPKRSISIPSGIEVIGRYAFYSLEDIMFANIPHSVKIIEDCAFYRTSLYRIEFPESVEYLGKYSFADTDLNKVHLSNNIKIIPEGCFSENCLLEIELSPSVTEIHDFAFGQCYCEVVVPEGVKQIGKFAFQLVEEIDLPSTLEFLSPLFPADDEFIEDYNPYIRVNPNNPWFYATDGTLYKRGQEEPYLGFTYKENIPQLIQFPDSSDEEYTLDELKSFYPEYNFRPINSEMTLFWTYTPLDGISIIDRCKHQITNKSSINNISFFFNGPVMLIDKNNNHYIYSNDLKELLFCDLNTPFIIYDFDKEGRVYVEESVTDLNPEDFSPFKSAPVWQWCIRYDGSPVLNQKYEGLKVFSKDGFAIAKLNNRWGMINSHEDIIIPFEYRELKPFNNNGLAEAKKGKRIGFIDRNNNVVIPFKYDYIYRHFNENGIAIAFIIKERKNLAVFINESNHILGTQDFKISSAQIWEKSFHIFKNDELYGYSLQFGHDFSGCKYKTINMLSPEHIRISEDGYTFADIKYPIS